MRIEVVNKELAAAHRDWRHIIANAEYKWRGNSISWSGYTPFMLPHEISQDMIIDLSSRRQFTFQLSDGSLILMLYDFDARTKILRKGCLWYIKNSPSSSDIDEARFVEENRTQVFQAEFEVSTPLVNWFRIDYDPSVSSIVHHACHLHLAGFEHCRIALNDLPTPRCFMEMVMAWMYPDLYIAHRLSPAPDDGVFREVNRGVFGLAVQSIEKYVAHIAMPVSIRAGTQV